ncbi:hypothetical protein M413DRAFT_31489 [Hebeloma cylindrosporum]|uniref:Uncharacterized protein n=1 Tax=Hebeloma cylindrosporum TaxID=76867 RepID=A0A0C2Y6J7_HEBCY|nr:hypothetical protein M413DRAFT_31489 [Hebeloma cylindrosporum h7]
MSGKRKPGPAASKVAVPQPPRLPLQSLAKKAPAVEPKATGPPPKGGAKPKKAT